MGCENIRNIKLYNLQSRGKGKLKGLVKAKLNKSFRQKLQESLGNQKQDEPS